MPESKEITISEFAQMHGLSQPIANGAVKFLEKIGAIEKTGERRSRKQGRASAVYTVPQTTNVTLLTDGQGTEAETETVEVTA